MPERRPDHSLELAIAVAVLGLLAAGRVYVWARRRGRNEVFAGGAADAAFGDLPPPNPDGSPRAAVAPTISSPTTSSTRWRRSSSCRPRACSRGRARCCSTRSSTTAPCRLWLSGLAGREAIEIDDTTDKVAIGSGRRRDELDATDAALLDGLIGTDGPYQTGKYDPPFATAWKDVAAMQKQRIAEQRLVEAHVARQPAQGRGMASLGLILDRLGRAARDLRQGGRLTCSPPSRRGRWRCCSGCCLPAFIAYIAYGVLLPARSAQGSALALRTESFRRFLHASEAQHVEWAWKHDLLREYSGWAVALGEADAWADALDEGEHPGACPRLGDAGDPRRTSPSITSSHVAPEQERRLSGGGVEAAAWVAEEAEAAAAPGSRFDALMS